MSTDWYTKLVLTVVAVCVALIVARNFRVGAESTALGEEGPGSYHVMPIPMARLVLRFDAESGKVWKAGLPELKAWTLIAESADEVLEEAAPEAGELEDVPAP